MPFNSVFSLHCSLGFCTSADPEDYCDTDAVDLRLNPVPSQMFVCGAISVHIFVNTGKKRIFNWSYSANKIKIHISALWQRGRKAKNKIKMHLDGDLSYGLTSLLYGSLAASVLLVFIKFD